MQQINIGQLHEKLQAGEVVYVLDVREVPEFEDFNMGAKLLPLSQIRNMDVDEIEDWKSLPVIVHCKSGVRSREACLLLETFGFSNTYNLEGGIMAWREQYGDLKLVN